MRTLTKWEEAITAELTAVGFRYLAREEGGGFWLHQPHGLEFSYNLDLGSRAASTYFELTWVDTSDGIVVRKMRLNTRKRKDEAVAKAIAGTLGRLLAGDWRNDKRWYIDHDFREPK